MDWVRYCEREFPNHTLCFCDSEISAETSFRLCNKITTCNDSYSVYELLNRIEDNGKKAINFDRLVEVQSGK